jgi:hypothetical protein
LRGIDSLLISYAALAFSSVVLLSLIGVNTVDVYVALFAIEFFVASELASALSHNASRRMTVMEFVLLAIFALIVLERVVEILS